jgi:hypothetical protein
MGAWSGATDGWEKDVDTFAITNGGIGYAGVYHAEGINGWTGPTGFLYNDLRAPMAPGESKTWGPLCVWGDPEYVGEVLPFSMEPDPDYPPPANRRYLLELLQRPANVEGGPPVGTVWELSLDRLLTLYLPYYTTNNGLTGYQFAFTITATPEPATMAMVALAALFARRRA